MKKRLLAWLLFIIPLSVLAAPPAILRIDAKAPMAETCQAVSAALEEGRFWVVFEADLGANMAGFAVVQEIEDEISAALRAGVAAAEGR